MCPRLPLGGQAACGLQFEYRCPLADAPNRTCNARSGRRRRHTYSITWHFQLLSKAKSPQHKLAWLGLPLIFTTSETHLRGAEAQLDLPLQLCCRSVLVGSSCVAHTVHGKKRKENTLSGCVCVSECVCVCVCVNL